MIQSAHPVNHFRGKEGQPTPLVSSRLLTMAAYRKPMTMRAMAVKLMKPFSNLVTRSPSGFSSYTSVPTLQRCKLGGW